MDRALLQRLLDRAERAKYISPAVRDAIQKEAEKSHVDARSLLVRDGWLTTEQFLRIQDERPSTHRKSSPLKVLGKYTLSTMLGRGGSSAVYKAWDEALKRWVAVKILNVGARAPDKTILERFFREARAIARLTHPNIIPIYEVGEDGGTYFLVIKYIEGATAHDIARGLEQRRAAEIVRDAARALDPAHKQGIVHRDVKPANILLEGEHVWVVDFGVAWDAFGDAGAALTREGMTLGTPAYMSPEQARGERVDAATDIYALGATLYTLVTHGAVPFEGEAMGDVMKRVVSQPPTPLEKHRPDIHAGLAAVIMKCLAKDARQRFASAAALANELDLFIAGQPVSTRMAKRPAALANLKHAPHVPPPSKPHAPLAIAGAIALAAVIGLIILISRNPKVQDGPKTATTTAPPPPPPDTKEDAARKRRRGEETLAEARRALQDAKLALAADRAREARLDLGEDARAYFIEGKALRLKSDLPAAIAALSKALELDPKHVESRINRALCHHRQYTCVAGFLTPFLQQHGPIDIGPYADFTDDAQPHAKKCIDDFAGIADDAIPPDDRAHARASMLVISKGLNEALQALPADPKEPEAALLRGRILQFSRRAPDAQPFLTRYIDRYPEDPHGWVIRGVNRLALNQPDAAIEDFAKGAAADPKCVHAPYCLGMTYHLKGFGRTSETSPFYADALKAYTTAIETDPKFPMTYLTRSLLFTHNKQLQKAWDDISIYIRIKPGASIGYNRRATIYIEMNDDENAIADYTTALSKNPSYFWGFVNRAQLYVKHKKWGEAIADCSSALAQQPGHVNSLVNRGFSYSQTARWVEAVRDWEQAIQLDATMEKQLADPLKNARERAKEQ